MFSRFRSMFRSKPNKHRHRPTRMAVERLEFRQLMASDVPGSMSGAMDLGPVSIRTIETRESIGTRNDVDMYKIQVLAGQQIGFDIDTPDNGPPGLGSYLRIFDSQGNPLAANNDRPAPDDPPPPLSTGGLGFDSYIEHRFDREGTYYVGVSNWLNSSYDPKTGMGLVFGNLWTTGDYALVIKSLGIEQQLVQPKSIAFHDDGSVTVGYTVTGALDVGTRLPISVYWSSGGTGKDALPSSAPRALFTYQHPASSGPGSYSFKIPRANMTTAPAATTHLLVVVNPQENLDAITSNPSVLAIPAHRGTLTAAQLRRAMPGLSAATAERMVGPLNQTMLNHQVETLEQQAMFLAQIGHESQNLTLWSEKYNGSSPEAYFINKYWVSRSRWEGLGSSIPTPEGITLRFPAGASSPATRVLELHFAKGPRLRDGAMLHESVTFTKSNGFYVAQFAGAIPPELTTHLLVVDPTNANRVLSAIRNREGNWQPSDAADFRGRGPIQLTGRYNYQLYAHYRRTPELMTNPSLLSDSTKPELGMNSAGWFWQVQYNRQLNEVTSSLSGSTSEQFNRKITKEINPGLNGLQDRLTRYRRIRASLFD